MRRIISGFKGLLDTQAIKYIGNSSSQIQIYIRHDEMRELIVYGLSIKAQAMKPSTKRMVFTPDMRFDTKPAFTEFDELLITSANELASVAHRFPLRSCSSSRLSNSALKFPFPKL